MNIIMLIFDNVHIIISSVNYCKLIVIDIVVHLHSIQNDTFIHIYILKLNMSTNLTVQVPLRPARHWSLHSQESSPVCWRRCWFSPGQWFHFPCFLLKVFLSLRKSLLWNQKKGGPSSNQGSSAVPFTPYLKKLMLEGAPHQVAKVVSISTNPQKAKTCQGIGHE